jgi:hypothetical protein
MSDDQANSHGLYTEETDGKERTRTRTAGEILFEKYLQQNGYLDYEFEPKIPGSNRPPDYLVRTRAAEVITDVKDFEPDDVTDLENCSGGAFDPHRRIRKRIEKLREKFKMMRGATPCVGVLHSPGVAVDVHLDDPEVMIPAMRGNVTIAIPFNEETGMFDSSRTEYGYGKGAHRRRSRSAESRHALLTRLTPATHTINSSQL